MQEDQEPVFSMHDLHGMSEDIQKLNTLPIKVLKGLVKLLKKEKTDHVEAAIKIIKSIIIHKKGRINLQ